MAETDDLPAAQAFQAFLVSPEGQAAIAGTGWQPVRDDVEWPYDGEVVTADWAELYGSQEQLLDCGRGAEEEDTDCSSSSPP